MIEVVATHGFDNRLKGHFAALGMGQFFCEHLRGGGANQREIPIADGRENGEGGASFERCVIFRPLVLIERLDDVIFFREGLPQAKSKNHFAIGEMAEDLAGGPFPGGQGLFRAFGAELFEKRFQSGGRGRDYFPGIAAS